MNLVARNFCSTSLALASYDRALVSPQHVQVHKMGLRKLLKVGLTSVYSLASPFALRKYVESVSCVRTMSSQRSRPPSPFCVIRLRCHRVRKQVCVPQ